MKVDTFHTQKYGGGYIQSCRRNGKKEFQINIPGRAIVPVKSAHAAKCLITRITRSRP